jgi:hypothetical protein
MPGNPTEPIMEKLGERDLSTIDLRTISPEEWQDVKREVVRRARAERARVMRELLRRLACWWQRRKQQRDPVVQTYASWRKHSP